MTVNCHAKASHQFWSNAGDTDSQLDHGRAPVMNLSVHPWYGVAILGTDGSSSTEETYFRSGHPVVLWRGFGTKSEEEIHWKVQAGSSSLSATGRSVA